MSTTAVMARKMATNRNPRMLTAQLLSPFFLASVSIAAAALVPVWKIWAIWCPT